MNLELFEISENLCNLWANLEPGTMNPVLSPSGEPEGGLNLEL